MIKGISKGVSYFIVNSAGSVFYTFTVCEVREGGLTVKNLFTERRNFLNKDVIEACTVLWQ